MYRKWNIQKNWWEIQHLIAPYQSSTRTIIYSYSTDISINKYYSDSLETTASINIPCKWNN